MKKLIFLFLITSSAIAQGPVDGYMKNKKDFAVGLSFTNEKANKLYAGKNPIDVGRTTRALSLFGIYGITNWLNVQVNIPYLNVNKGTETDFQDGSIYLKFRLLKKDNSKGNFNLLLATGYSDPLTNYRTSGGSAIGQMAIAGDGRLIAQQNFKNNFFASVQAGYFLKTDPTPNAMSSSLKIGYAGNFYADVWFETLQAFGGNDYISGGKNEDFRSFGFSYNKIGGTFYYSLHKHIGAFVGASYVLSGRNAFRNTGLNIGIVFQ